MHLNKSYGSGLALAVVKLFEKEPKPTILFTNSIAKSYTLQQDLQFFSKDKNIIKVFPDWEVLPFDSFSPQAELINKRMEILASLLKNDNYIYVICINTALAKIMPKEYFTTTEFNIKINQSIAYEDLRYNLLSYGYSQVDTVYEPGEFATRGSLIDLYPSDSGLPYRIDLFGDEIESIKIFDPKTQRTIKTCNKIKIHGASEYPLDTNYREIFIKNWQTTFPNHINHIIPKSIEAGKTCGGAEFMLALFFDKLGNIFDYSNKMRYILPENYKKLVNKYLLEIENRRNICVDNNVPCLGINDVYLSLDNLQEKITKNEYFLYNTKPGFTKNQTHSIPLKINKDQALEDLIKIIVSDKHRVLISTNQETRKNYYITQLEKANIKSIKTIYNWEEFINSNYKVCIINSSLSHGCEIIADNIIIITESDLVDHEQQDYSYKERRSEPNTGFDLSQIKINDYVIHADHGIGQYLGLTKISGTSDNNEYIKLLYANEDKLYIPVTDLDKIYSYRSAALPELAKLGSKKWQNTKKKAIEKMVDSATELLDLYSQRNLAVAKKYNKPGKDYIDFSNEFPFTETPDQAKAIAEITDSLRSNKLTDRLICGDVGFGKTEIAMRAAFLAVASKLQVVVIAPTTLLASQHFNSFVERFANWPINIALYSGTMSVKDSIKVKDEIKKGKLDIIISTHKILSNKLEFSNLGLLIIDEEHRFGVKQKEKLKEIKLDVDVVSLTATPIPRTLQLACTKLRDLSIIATPPQERLPIKTYISTFDEKLIIEAITREVNRGGQVYYMYNEVAKINTMAEYLEQLLPNLKIVVAHGQMPKAQLTNAMTKFYNKQAHICLCSTIVESGIDIPNANTIIIDRADKLGLAQLHQIRGRVGRSSHQAYAYLFTPDTKFLTNEAKQRLDAIEKHNTLGSGFQLAILDMEIRGAGELLGSEQSGHIKELGFDYYISLINDTTEAIKNNIPLDANLKGELNIDIDTYFPVIIPEIYISNPATRLNTYKRIAKISDDQQRFNLLNELEDIYGKPPPSVKHLLYINLIKSLSLKSSIASISIKEEKTNIKLLEEPNINTNELINLITTEPNIYKIKGNIIAINYTKNDVEEQLEMIISFIQKILPTKTIENIQ